jgi:REP-associated tyrosine transposase
MSRRPRFPLTDLPLHVVQRGNNRSACFFQDRDYRVYLKVLGEACRHYGVLVHAYALMTNHVHLLMTPRIADGVSRVMQSVGARYVRYVNRSCERTGSLWEGRYRACLVACDRHLLAACRYIDLNPVRAGLAACPADYAWSSYLALVGARNDTLVTPHSVLDTLGAPHTQTYARWCAEGDVDAELDRLRKATAAELVFGTDEFKIGIESTTARAAFAKPRGFPPGRTLGSETLGSEL